MGKHATPRPALAPKSLTTYQSGDTVPPTIVITGEADLDLYRAAPVAHTSNGWAIFPSTPRTKRPRAGLTDWERRATKDPHVASTRWRDGENVCLACGPSGIVVVDLDVGKALPEEWRLPGVVDGRDVLAVLAERAGARWPSTYTVATPTGGWQLYYTAIPGRDVRPSAGKVGPMVDARGVGGYVLGVGSILDGRAYADRDSDTEITLQNGGQYTVAVDVPLEPLPRWLADLLAPPPRERQHPAPVHTLAGRGSGYSEAALRSELETVLTAPNGERNVTLHRASFNLGQLVGGGALEEGRVEALLSQAGTSIGLTDREVRGTVASGMKAGAANPRGGAA